MSARKWAAAITVALAFASGGTVFGQDPRVLPDTIGDLNTLQLVEVLDSNGQVLLHGTLKTSSNTPKQIERSADLVSPTGQKTKGKVDIEIERKDSVVKHEVEVDLQGMPTSMQCELRLDGRAAATFLTSKQGRAKFELERKETAPAATRK